MPIIAPGSTNVSLYFKLVDPAAGTPETGLTIANLSACYVRDGADHSASTALTALATVTTAHTDNYGIEIDATACPGLYRVDYPDAAFAAGVGRVQCIVTGAAIDPAVIEVELVPWVTAVTGAYVLADIKAILATALTETVGGYLAAGFKKLHDVAAPVLTLASVNQTGDSYAYLGTNVGALGANLTAADDATLAAIATVQASVDSIGSGTGAALNFAATGDNTGGALKGVSFVGSQALTYAATAAEDASRHAITDSGGTPDIDIVYSFNIGAGRNAAKVVWKGLVSAGDTVTVQAYNGSTWDTRATIPATGTTNVTKDISLLATHTGTGADAGLVYIRFVATGQTAILLSTDELLVAGVSVGLTVGYDDGAIWIDTNTGTAGTSAYIHGTADKPVSTLADAVTLAAAVGVRRYRLVGNSTITLTSAHANWYFRGGTIALGSQSVDGSVFDNCVMSGICTGAILVHNAELNGVSGFTGDIRNSVLRGTIAPAAGATRFILCGSAGPATGYAPTMSLAAGNITVGMRGYFGKMTVTNCTASDILSFDCPAGELILDATDTAGEIRLRGVHNYTLGGATTTITDDALAPDDVDIIESQTDDIGVAGAGLTALGDTRLANLDAAVTTRSSHSAADVWSVGTRTLTSFGTLVADIWAGITAAAAAKIADIVLRRTTANVEASSDGDTISGRSLYGAVARLAHKVSVSGSILTVKKSDDATTLTTADLTTDATADPITSVDPAA